MADNRLLIRAGFLLYGLNWQTALAQDLGVNVRTVRRWAANQYRFRDYAKLTAICLERSGELYTMAEELSAPHAP